MARATLLGVLDRENPLRESISTCSASPPMDDESPSFPPIEPSNFDLIVVGTGLPESILASAASAAGKTVLHLDPNPFYGSHSASLPIDDLVPFLKSQSEPQTLSQSQSEIAHGGDGVCITLSTRPLYTDVEINAYSPDLVGLSRKFSLDLAGPRVFLCSDSMIDLILRTDVNQYMEFKSVEACFLSDAEGKLESVPDSRGAIFKSRTLSLPEKNQLMKFFKLVQGHVGSESEENKISEEDLGSPFVDFLTKMGLSEKLKSIILYTIVMADYDQRNLEVCKEVMDTKSGINGLALYHSSIGRFPNANGAIIYPIYGQGELPQAFCRRAAVKGCIYVLRMPVVSVLMDKDGQMHKGVKLASGQELFSSQLILAPHFTIPSTSAPIEQVASSHNARLSDTEEKVARGICIAKNSVKPGVSNCMVFFPPKSLYPEQITTVRVLHLSGNVAACPSGMFVTYLSAKCGNAVEGKKLLNEAINTLFCKEHLCENTEGKPCLLWSALYIQELTEFRGASQSITFTPMPDEHLHYNNLLDATKKLFQEIYPNEEFFPKISTTDDDFCDDGST
ncbi:Rab escort protein [Striga hermonthica]|uniref:Rab escort protein 1 n=1 Tax=Striga hermonthica TaxID=68872 RepID=A0A9N7NJC6_STRHE|nr:Rab escort protein [Striga hermonthica]